MIVKKCDKCGVELITGGANNTDIGHNGIKGSQVGNIWNPKIASVQVEIRFYAQGLNTIDLCVKCAIEEIKNTIKKFEQ